MKEYTEVNARTVDRWVDDGWEWGTPVSHEVCGKARRGEWDVLLTPTKPVPHEWFPPFPGCRLLGLASGGGQQIPIFSLLGASCTVLDYSARQLEQRALQVRLRPIRYSDDPRKDKPRKVSATTIPLLAQTICASIG